MGHLVRPDGTINKAATEKKQFDLGIYQFRQLLRGPLCKDEHKLQPNSIVAVLHPLKVVDPDNLYCFALDFSNSLDTLTLMRKNLNFKKVITLTYEHEPTMDYVQEIHAKYHAAAEYLKKTEQLTIPV